MLENMKFISHVETGYLTHSNRFAQWDILVNTLNKLHIFAHPGIIIYLVVAYRQYEPLTNSISLQKTSESG